MGEIESPRFHASDFLEQALSSEANHFYLWSPQDTSNSSTTNPSWFFDKVLLL